MSKNQDEGERDDDVPIAMYMLDLGDGLESRTLSPTWLSGRADEHPQSEHSITKCLSSARVWRIEDPLYKQFAACGKWQSPCVLY